MGVGKKYKQRRTDAERYYKSIGEVICAALGNQKVVFQNRGFKHLIYKDKKFRPVPEQLRRFDALYKVEEIILTAKYVDEYRVEEKGPAQVFFWAFDRRINEESIRVVLRRIGDGPVHFFSVRSRKNTKPPGGGL